MVETLEETLNRINIPDAAVKIDRLEMDIVLNENGNWLEQLAINVSAQLQKQLEEKMFAGPGNESGSTKLGSSENFFEAVIFFLQQGILPWWFTSKGQDSFFEELDTLLDQGFSGQMKTVMKEIVSNENVQQRIAWQLPEKIFYKLVEDICSMAMPGLDELVASVEKLTERLSANEKKEIQQLLRKIIIEEAEETSQALSEKQIVEKFVQAITVKRIIPVMVQQAAMIRHKYLREAMILETTRPVSQDTKEEKEEQVADINKANDAVPVKPFKEKSKSTDIAAAAEEGFYISNAGLVIAAGFLPLIFNKLSLLEGNQITDINKAICLVQYLASGNDVVAEFELGLAKILCGLEMETPVDTAIELSVIEKEEATELLLSVIEYWSIIKDTTITGLRESFLVREGKLSFINEQWLLQVEQKPFDMLLQSLPWNISMIKLPWMKYLLKTEWAY